MKRDGRGQVMALSWFGRAARWVVANPLFGLIAMLLAGLGMAKVRASHLENRARKSQADADLARLKLRRETAKAADVKHEAAQKDVDATLATAGKAKKAAASKNRHHGDALRELEKRWPTK